EGGDDGGVRRPPRVSDHRGNSVSRIARSWAQVSVELTRTARNVDGSILLWVMVGLSVWTRFTSPLVHGPVDLEQPRMPTSSVSAISPLTLSAEYTCPDSDKLV